MGEILSKPEQCQEGPDAQVGEGWFYDSVLLYDYRRLLGYQQEAIKKARAAGDKETVRKHEWLRDKLRAQQYQEGLCLAQEWKHRADAQVGEEWYYDSDLLYVYDYKRLVGYQQEAIEKARAAGDKARVRDLEYLQDMFRTRGLGGGYRWMQAMIASVEDDSSAFRGMQAVGRYELQKLVSTSNRNIPAELAAFLADSMEEGKGKQRPRRNTYRRNKEIIQIIAHIIAITGLKATRNDENYGQNGYGRSACDAVAEALGVAYSTILGIWKKRDRDQLLPLPPRTRSEILSDLERIRARIKGKAKVKRALARIAAHREAQASELV